MREFSWYRRAWGYPRLVMPGLAMVGLLSLALTLELNAQEWDGMLGAAVPVGEFSTMVGAGPAVGIGVGQRVVASAGVRVRADVSFLRSDPVPIRPIHLAVGFFSDVKPSSEGPWRLAIDGLIGGTSFLTRGTWVWIPENPIPREAQLSTSLSTSVGVEVIRQLSDGLEVVVQGRMIRIFARGERSEGGSGAIEEGFGALSLVPLSIGGRWVP